jgi:3',5'-cyclic AMP phosphodiesterase CpdA
MIVAQLSDIHADGTSDPFARLDKVLGWLEPLQPDAVIVSGDLAEYAQSQCYQEIRDRLESLGAPSFVVPGNVDDPELMRQAFGDRFDWQGQGKLNCVGVLGAGLRVIGLDVTVQGAHHGDAQPVLRWLEAELASSSVPSLIFQHQHPFMCGIDGKDRNYCYNQEALAAVIGRADSNVLALTCGHVHRPMFTRFAGLPATMAPSVARANRLRLDGKESTISDPPGLLLHHLQESRLVSHVVMVT